MERSYLVYPVGEMGEYSTIVRAETPGKAKAQARGILDDGCADFEFTELRARRAPEFDGKPLTDRLHIENGWYVWCKGEECAGDALCSLEDEDGEMTVVYDEAENAYHSQSCLEYTQQRKRSK